MLSRYGTDENGELIKKAIVYTKSEHFISKDKIDPDALQIIHRLHDLGFIAYIVGGAVRDLIVGNKPKDFDDFISQMKEKGYSVKFGKHIKK